MRPGLDIMQQEGYTAFTNGKTLADNPYLNDVYDYKAENWQKGFVMAEEDKFEAEHVQPRFPLMELRYIGDDGAEKHMLTDEIRFVTPDVAVVMDLENIDELNVETKNILSIVLQKESNDQKTTS
jgi:hypothetical protein